MSSEVFLDDKEVRDFLKHLDVRLKEIKGGKRQYQRLLTTIVYKDVNEHFAKEQGEDGPWPEWSLSYAMAVSGQAAFRRFRGRTVMLNPYQMEEYGIKPPRKPGKKLQNNGRLRNNFAITNVRSESRGISWFNNAVTKSGFPYAWAHNEGTERLPKRDFMWASEKSQDEMAVQTLQYILEMGV